MFFLLPIFWCSSHYLQLLSGPHKNNALIHGWTFFSLFCFLNVKFTQQIFTLELLHRIFLLAFDLLEDAFTLDRMTSDLLCISRLWRLLTWLRVTICSYASQSSSVTLQHVASDCAKCSQSKITTGSLTLYTSYTELSFPFPLQTATMNPVLIKATMVSPNLSNYIQFILGITWDRWLYLVPILTRVCLPNIPSSSSSSMLSDKSLPVSET